MTRRHILAAPFAALFGKVAPKPARKGVWYRKRLHVYPPTDHARWRPFVTSYRFGNHRWEPVLKQINPMPEP